MLDFTKIEISVYEGVRDTEGKVTTLHQFLHIDPATLVLVQRIRNLEGHDTTQRDMKKSLPQAAISGVFSSRHDTDLVTHSGLICIDIDSQDNPGKSPEQMKHQAAQLPYVAYAGLSVRGKGVFCIVPIAEPDKHERHYLACCDEFERFTGLHPDRACKNVGRLRCASYDPAPHVNLEATEYTGLAEPEQYTAATHISTDDETLSKVYRCVANLERYRIDITANYADWFTIGAALASLGEQGRDPFHRVSAINSNYRYKECNRKFDNLLRTTHSIGIGTFFQRYDQLCGIDT